MGEGGVDKGDRGGSEGENVANDGVGRKREARKEKRGKGGENQKR